MSPLRSRPVHTRAAAAALSTTAVVAMALLVQLPQATAQTVSTAGSHASSHPLAPRHTAAAPAVIGGPLINHGGPVQTAPRVYVDFWGWTSDPHGEQSYLDNFLSSVGGTPWLATVNQYGAASPGHLLAGTWSDPAAVPAAPSDAQIQAEAASAASHFGAGNSVNVQIVVATPTGHSTPGFGSQWCAYHGAVTSDPSITYTDLPYISDAGSGCGQDSVNGANGTLDGVSIVEGHELAETLTDPLINGWIDAGGYEIGDKCAWFDLSNIKTAGGSFAVQPLWSNAANGCVLSTAVATPPVLALLGSDGTVSAKAGGLSAGWVTETSGIKQIAIASDPVNGPLIAVLSSSGTVSAKEGGLSAGWVTETSGVKQIAVASDPVNGPLIVVLGNDGTVSAKEGGLSAGWVTETSGISQIAVASDPTNGPLIAVLGNDGTVSAKEGGLSAGWVTETTGISQIAVASDPTNGPLIAVLNGGGTVAAKEGGLSAGWVTEAGGISQIAVASDPVNGPLITVIGGGTVSAKEGGLSAGWVTETTGIAQIAVASDPVDGPLIAVQNGGGTVSAKEGGLSAGWVTENSGGAVQVSVAG